jgi:hypothetical protein
LRPRLAELAAPQKVGANGYIPLLLPTAAAIMAAMGAMLWLMDYRDTQVVMSLRLRRQGCHSGADLYPFQPGVVELARGLEKG